jgi:hypothetical protein
MQHPDENMHSDKKAETFENTLTTYSIAIATYATFKMKHTKHRTEHT